MAYSGLTRSPPDRDVLPGERWRCYSARRAERGANQREGRYGHVTGRRCEADLPGVIRQSGPHGEQLGKRAADLDAAMLGDVDYGVERQLLS
jgi:hypothetical protein